MAAPSRGCAPDRYWRSVAAAVVSASGVGDVLAADSPDEASRARVHRILGTVDSPVVLVLDHPDRVADRLLYAHLADLVVDLDHVRVVLCVRTSECFRGMADLELDCQVITPLDLEFTTDETAQVFALAGLSADRATTDAIHELVGGWSVLARMAVSVARLFGGEFGSSRGVAADAVERAVDAYVEDAILADPMLEGVSELVVICSTAVDLTPEVLSVLTGDSVSEARLIDLEYAGVISRATSPGTREWRMVPALRESLMRRVRKTTPIRPLPNSVLLARYYLSADDIPRALFHAVEAQDWNLVGVILKSNWVRVFSADVGLLRDALAKLPDAVVESDATLRAGRAVFSGPGLTWTRLSDQADEIEDLASLEGAEGATDLIEVATAHVIGLRVVGKFSDAADLAKRLAKVVDDLGSPSGLDRAGLSVMKVQWAITMQLAGRYGEAARCFRDTYRDAVQHGPAFVATNAAACLALHFAMADELHHAEAWLERVARHGVVPGRLGEMVAVPSTVARALVALERLDIEAAAPVMDELADVPDDEEYWAFVQYAHHVHAMLTGSADRGLVRVRRAKVIFERWTTEDSGAAALLATAESELLCALGRGNEAWQILGDGQRENAFVRVSRARVELLNGHPERALAERRSIARSAASYTRIYMDASIVEAQAELALGRLAQARRIFLRVVSLSEQTGAVRPFAAVPAARLEALAEGADLPDAWSRVAGRYERGVFPEKLPVIALTDRERAVLRAVADGSGIVDVAGRLFVSPNTVKSQLRSAYRKLGVSSRQEALVKAKRLSLL
ncbi:LuxR C-terminal-related transcriptional regulator [Rhodococcus hoagii]|nr:LuxR C-terminal-related transcriptional regulator [Prescottella equi]